MSLSEPACPYPRPVSLCPGRDPVTGLPFSPNPKVRVAFVPPALTRFYRPTCSQLEGRA